MSVDVIIEKVNDVHLVIRTDRSVAMEMNEYFAFFTKNYKWDPRFKNNKWDGRLRLFHLSNYRIYTGLVYEVIRFCIDREYTFRVDDAIGLLDSYEIDSQGFLDSLKIPFEPYDYQKKALELILAKKRRLLLSPTSSGKSLIIYLATRFLLDRKQAKKILVVVPTTTLVEQLVKDFESYAENINWDAEEHCHKIYDYDGVTKTTDKPIVVTTWQSIYNLPKKWFNDFQAVFVDEAHQAQATSIKKIMEKLTNCPYRVGLTGTIEDTETHKLVLTGLFGKIYKTTTTRELMDKGIVSTLQIKGIIFKHNDTERRQVSKLKYQDELDHVLSDERRNKFIHKLATSQRGNTLVLFNRVEKHGVPLFERMQKQPNGKDIFFVYGNTPTEEREEIRAYAETHDNVVIVASYGTFSTGINIKNLDNLVFAHPYKAKIKNLQSIGRGLRISTKSDKAVLYDLADDYKWKSKENTTMKHFKERLRLYNAEGFDYKLTYLELA